MQKTGIAKSGRRSWLTAYAPLIIWIGVILFLGSGQGSMTRTSIFVRPLLQVLFPSADEATLLLYHGYIRKSAHIFEYAVLGFLAFRAFAATRLPVIFALLLTLSIAALDEFLQSFDPQRTSSPYDVLIDLCGGTAAVLIACVILKPKMDRI